MTLIPTENELGDSLKVLRKSNPATSIRYVASQLANEPEHLLRVRETNGVPIRISEFIKYMNCWGIDPVDGFRQLLENCDRIYWEGIATKLGRDSTALKQSVENLSKSHQLPTVEIIRQLEEGQLKL